MHLVVFSKGASASFTAGARCGSRNNRVKQLLCRRGGGGTTDVKETAGSAASRAFSTSTTSSSSLFAGNDLVGWNVQPLLVADDHDHTDTDVAAASSLPKQQPQRFVGTLTLQSPANLNALSVEMARAFESAVREISQDNNNNNDVDVIVLQGAGDAAFSAGGDLQWLESLRQNSVHENADNMRRFYQSFLCLRQYLTVPVICALHGPAMGAGAGLALACDLRTAAPRPNLLGLHFTRLGIHTGMGASHYVPQIVKAGSAVVNEILLAGKILSGQECYDLGIVNRLEEDAKGAAYELAREITLRQHPVAVRSLLQTLRRQQDVGLEQALQREALAQAACYARDDWGEGVRAIAAKRDPIFDPYSSK